MSFVKLLCHRYLTFSLVCYQGQTADIHEERAAFQRFSLLVLSIMAAAGCDTLHN